MPIVGVLNLPCAALLVNCMLPVIIKDDELTTPSPPGDRAEYRRRQMAEIQLTVLSKVQDWS